MNERNGIALFMLGIWKLRNLTGEAETDRFSLCKELENNFIIIDLGLTIGTVE